MIGDIHEVQRLLARERLAIDDAQPGRTCFLSHLGAQAKLNPGPWIAHRDLLYALALANLSPAQRTSLGRAVLVEYGREFGVGQLLLRAQPSGLPLGGSSLHLRPRQGGQEILHTWGFGIAPAPAHCDWLLMRAEPHWCTPEADAPLRIRSLTTLVGLGGSVVLAVRTAVEARQIADLCAGKLDVAAHPRFSPHLEGHDPSADVLLWPMDALESESLTRRTVVAVVLIDATESELERARDWVRRCGGKMKPELSRAGCPGRADPAAIESFWRACDRPKVLVRGPAQWIGPGSRWLQELGAHVETQGEASQLGLF